MIMIFAGPSVLAEGDPLALSSRVRRPISHLTIPGTGRVTLAAIGAVIGVLAGWALVWLTGGWLPPGRWARVGSALSAELISDATVRPS